MDITPRLSVSHLHKDLEDMCNGALILFRDSKNMTGVSTRDAGKAVLLLMPPTLDVLVEAYTKRGGEKSEIVIANYWYTKALASAMAGSVGSGEQYINKAKRLRTGGVFWEWCQKYYSV